MLGGCGGRFGDEVPSGSAAGFGAGAAGTGAAAAVAGAPAVPPITATTELIWTVVPALALISVRTPAAGEGISASTLSVEISKSGSSRSTLSPTCLSHLVMVPSKMDSPICGMMTSVAGPEPDVGAEAAGAGASAGAKQVRRRASGPRPVGLTRSGRLRPVRERRQRRIPLHR